MAHLKDRYRCVTTDLPGFSVDDDDDDDDNDPGDCDDAEQKADYLKKNGCTVDEIVGRLEATIEQTGNGSPVTVIAHDWGW